MIAVSWPAWRLLQLVRAGNAPDSIADTARLLKLDEQDVLEALAELQRAGIVPHPRSEAVAA